MSKTDSENCRVCGRPLFSEESKKRGMGLTCWKKQQKEAEA